MAGSGRYVFETEEAITRPGSHERINEDGYCCLDDAIVVCDGATALSKKDRCTPEWYVTTALEAMRPFLATHGLHDDSTPMPMSDIIAMTIDEMRRLYEFTFKRYVPENCVSSTFECARIVGDQLVVSSLGDSRCVVQFADDREPVVVNEDNPLVALDGQAS